MINRIDIMRTGIALGEIKSKVTTKSYNNCDLEIVKTIANIVYVDFVNDTKELIK